MTEFRIVCDHVRTDKKGNSRVFEARHPMGETGNTIQVTYKTREEAEISMEMLKKYGEAYERNQTAQAAKHPDLYSTITRQVNYRIQSREVTEWR